MAELLARNAGVALRCWDPLLAEKGDVKEGVREIDESAEDIDRIGPQPHIRSGLAVCEARASEGSGARERQSFMRRPG